MAFNKGTHSVMMVLPMHFSQFMGKEYCETYYRGA